MIRVVAIDDHPLILDAISDGLSKHSDIQLVGTAPHGSMLMNLVREQSPDVVILDLGMAKGEFDPIAAVHELLQSHPNVRILILTGNDSPMYMRALTAAGVKGYLLKSDTISLPDAVRTLASGRSCFSSTVVETLISASQAPVLNSREMEVLHLAAQGLKSGSIAEMLNITEKRVRNILSSIYQKMGIQENDEGSNSRVMMINQARKIGLLK